MFKYLNQFVSENPYKGVIMLTAVLTVSACTGRSGEDSAPADAGAESSSKSTDDAGLWEDDFLDAGYDASIPTGCSNIINGGVDEVRVIDSYDGKRKYNIIVPVNYAHDQKTPLLFAFHDRGESALEHIELSGLRELAAENALIVVVIHGLPIHDGGPSGWNTGVDGGAPHADIPVVLDLIEKLQAEWCIDSDRIFVSGFGMGGFFANRLMFFLDEFLAGAQVEAAGLNICCRFPRYKRSVVLIHGEEDEVYPVSGGEEIRDYWIGHNELLPSAEIDANGCYLYKPPPKDSTLDAGNYVEVMYCPVDGMEHARAGVSKSPGDGTVAPFNASRLGWEFLSSFSR